MGAPSVFTAPDPTFVRNVPWNFDSRADLASELASSSNRLSEGDTAFVGGVSYLVDSTATGNKSALFDLGQDGVRFKGSTIKANWFGDINDGTDASTILTNANTHFYALRTGTSETLTLVVEGEVALAEPVTFGGTGRMNIDMSNARFNVIAGGTLESSSTAMAITIKAGHSLVYLGSMECNHLCGGYVFDTCANSTIIAQNVKHFDYRGYETTGNCAGSVIHGLRGYEWDNTETEFNTTSNFVATGVYSNTNDVRFVAPHIGWCKYPIFNAAGGTGCQFYQCHPYNGNPNSGHTMDNPYDFVNEAGSNVYIYDAYFDNGYVDDRTGTLSIYNAWQINLNSDLTDPIIRIKAQSPITDNTNVISNVYTSVGFYTGDWSSSPATPTLVSDLVATASSMAGISRTASVIRRDTRLIPDSGNGIEYLIAKQGDTSTRIRQRWTPGTGGDVFVDYEDDKVTVTTSTVTFSVGQNTVNITGLPTSSSGLSSGDLWNDSGTIKIV